MGAFVRIIFVLLLQLGSVAFSQVPTLDSISNEDLDTIVKEFSTGFVHTSATPPTSLGKVFGVEAAMIAGINESPGVEAISQRIDPQSEVKYLPHLWLLGGFSVPYGVSVELNVLPELDIENLKMNHMSAGIKWSVTDKFLKGLPFDLAIRTYYSKSEMSYVQTVSNPSFPATSTVKVSFENVMVGGDTLFGVDLGMLEPYGGVGFVSTTGTLRGTATTSTPYSLFDDLVSDQKESKQSSVRLLAGCMFHLTALNIGLEYTNLFATHRVSAKLGVQF